MDPLTVVRTMWARIDARDWDGVRALLHPDITLEYPVTNEVFRGADAVIAINAEYPDGWRVRPRTFLLTGDAVVAEVDVPMGRTPFRSVGIWEVHDGAVVSGREYWVQPGSEEAPAWRTPYRSA
ncbi:MAG: nuclear transport factor 2 family protein [Amnibacterium sp.]